VTTFTSVKRRTILVPAALIIIVTVLSQSTVTAPVSAAGTYSIDWYTVDDGGAMGSTGGTYSIGGTIGQSDAGAQSGGTYTLSGGFWTVEVFGYRVNLPLITR
jgi:hypothetical protein